MQVLHGSLCACVRSDSFLGLTCLYHARYAKHKAGAVVQVMQQSECATCIRLLHSKLGQAPDGSHHVRSAVQRCWCDLLVLQPFACSALLQLFHAPEGLYCVRSAAL